MSSNIVQPNSSLTTDPNLNNAEENTEIVAKQDESEENLQQDPVLLASVQSFIDLLEKKVPLGNTVNQPKPVVPVPVSSFSLPVTHSFSENQKRSGRQESKANLQ